MDDLRWFAPNRYCTLPVPALRRGGLSIALEGNRPARLAVAADGQSAVEGYQYARRHRRPLLLYLWDLPPWRLGAGRPDFIFELAGRIRRLPRLLGGYAERPGYYSRIGFVARRAAAVWCPSENTVTDVRARLHVEAEKVPFCFDSDRFQSLEAPRSSAGPPILLSISRLVPHKNHQVVIRAAARLTPAPLVRIIGQGPLAEPLRRLAGTLGVPLELTDTWASDDQVVAAYRSASVVVCPSRFEGFGLTPMEGIAMGLPVIVSDIPVHREFLSGRAGFFPPDDDAALAEQLRQLLRSGPRQVREAPLPDFTIEACAARFLSALPRVLERPA